MAAKQPPRPVITRQPGAARKTDPKPAPARIVPAPKTKPAAKAARRVLEALEEVF